METTFLNYFFGYGRVAALANSGSYQGRCIDGIGRRRRFSHFSPVSVARLDVTSCTLPESSTFAEVPLERQVVYSSSGCVGTTLLQEGVAARLALSCMVNVLRTNGLAIPEALQEPLQWALGGISHPGHMHFAPRLLNALRTTPLHLLISSRPRQRPKPLMSIFA